MPWPSSGPASNVTVTNLPVLGPTVPATSLPVTVSEGRGPSVQFTRPANATAYSVGAAIGNSTSAIHTFSNAAIVGKLLHIISVNYRVDVTAIPSGMTTHTLHLFNAEPVAVTDGTVWTLNSADRSKYLGNVLLSSPVIVGANMLWSATSNVNVPLLPISTSIFGILVTNGAFTPTSGAVKTITLLTSDI
jgi:hypothetical protein